MPSFAYLECIAAFSEESVAKLVHTHVKATEALAPAVLSNAKNRTCNVQHSNGTRRKQFNVHTTEREIHTATVRTPEGPSCTVMQNICESVTDIYYYGSVTSFHLIGNVVYILEPLQISEIGTNYEQSIEQANSKV